MTMTSREQFERWFSPQDELMRTNGLGVTSRGRKREAAWYAWQASRWAIEVELPNADIMRDGEDFWREDNLFECLNSYGIKVKK